MTLHRFSRSKLQAALLLPAALSWLLAPALAGGEPTALPPGDPGPLGFVQSNITVRDPLGRREVSVLLVRPATPEGSLPVGGGPFPLVIFSHGNSTFPEANVALFQHLASHGYVVAGPRHAGSVLGDDLPRRTTESAVERPGEVSLVLDELLRLGADASSPLNGLIDGTRLAMMGQSFGGLTTLAVRGATIDISRLDDVLVEQGSEPIASYCDRVGWQAGSLTCGRIREAVATRGRASVGDPRFDVGVPITPAGFAIFGSPGLADTLTPNLILAGQLDTTVSFADEILPMFEALPPTKILVNMQRAGHTSNTSLCGTVFDQAAPEDCPAILEATRTFVTAFLGLHLQSVDAYADFLSPDFAATLEDVELFSEQAQRVLSIDVRPWRDSDRILARPLAPVRVAILGSEDLEVWEIDLDSLELGPSAAAPERVHVLDVDRDGRDDLVARFRFGKTGLALGDTEVCLEARAGGEPARGCTPVKIGFPGCGRGHEQGWLAVGLLMTPAVALRHRRRVSSRTGG